MANRFFCVFVDDVLFIHDGEDQSEMEEIINKIKKKYDVSDGGECKYILGMRVTRSTTDSSLIIDQQAFLERTLEGAGMSNCIPVETPESVGIKLTSFGSTTSQDSTNTKEIRVTTIDTDDLDEEMQAKYRRHVDELHLSGQDWT